jgi:hypothetical protein
MKIIGLIILIFWITWLYSSSPHPVMIEVQTSYGSPPSSIGLSFQAWRLGHPNTVLDLGSTDCYYPAFGIYLHINCGSFAVWNPGDTLRVEVFDDLAEEWYSQDYELNGENIQTFDIGNGGMVLGVRLDLPDQIGFRYYDGLIFDMENYLSYMWDDNYIITIEGNENIEIEIDSLILEMSADGSWFGSEALEITFDSNSFRTVAVDTIEVEVYPNHAPVFQFPEGGFYFNEDEELSMELMNYCTDFENDTLYFDIGNYEILICEISGSELYLSAPLNWFGSEVITITAEDGQNRVLSSAEVNIAVLAVNDPPQLYFPDYLESEEDTVIQFTISEVIYDVDGDSLYIYASGNEFLTLEATAEMIYIYPELNWFGTETVIINVFDQTITVADTVTFDILPVNDPPEIDLPDYKTFAADLPMTMDFSPYVNDVDNEILFMNAEAEHILISFEGLLAEFTTLDNWHGSEDVLFIIDDGVERISASDTMTINCFLLEDSIIEISDVSIDEGNYLEIDINSSEIFEHWSVSSYEFILYYDPYYLQYFGYTTEGTLSAGGNVSLEVTEENQSAQINITYNHYLPLTGEGSILKIWFSAECYGEVEITGSEFYYNNQQIGGVIPGNVSINDIGNSSHPPQAIAGEDFSVFSGAEAFLDGTLSWDPDGDDLEYLWQAPEEIVLDDPTSSTPSFIAPIVNVNTDFEIILQVTDPEDHSSYDSVIVTILYQNFAPQIDLPESLEILEDNPIEVDFSPYLHDDNGDDLSLSCEGSEYINVEISELIVNFSPAENWFGEEYLTFIVSDDITRLFSSDSLLIIVLPVNDPPNAGAGDNISIRDGEAGILDGSDSYDIDSEELSYFWESSDNIAIADPYSVTTTFITFDCEASITEIVYLTVDDQQSRLTDTDSLLVTITDDEVRNLEAVNLGELSVELSWEEPYAYINGVYYEVFRDSIMVDNTEENSIIIESAFGLHSFGVRAVYPDGYSEIVSIQIEVTDQKENNLPVITELRQIFPNPFNPSTEISYTLAEDTFLDLTIYNIKGQKVVQLVNEHKKAGYHKESWNAVGLASGVYFVKMNSARRNQKKKVILIK